MGQFVEEAKYAGEQVSGLAAEAKQACNDQAGNGSRYTRSNVNFVAARAQDLLDILDGDGRVEPTAGVGSGYSSNECLRRIHEYCLLLALAAHGDAARLSGQEPSQAIDTRAREYREGIRSATGPHIEQLATSPYRSQNVFWLKQDLREVAALSGYDPNAPRPDGDTLGLGVDQIAAVTRLAERMSSVRAAAAFDWDQGTAADLRAREPRPQIAYAAGDGRALEH